MSLREAILTCAALLSSMVTGTGCMDNAVARAGHDQTVEAGATVTLDGSKSTPNRRGALSYTWQVDEGPEVTFSAATGQTTTFQAPRQGTETRFIVRLTVTYLDYAGRLVPSNSSSDDTIVRVHADPDLLGQEPSDDESTDDGEPANENADGQDLATESIFGSEEDLQDASTAGGQAP